MRGILLVLYIIPALSSGQDKQLILHVPAQSESNIIRIGKQLSCLDGCHFSGYAKSASCLLLRYDSNIIRDESIIPVLIRRLNNKLKVELITGITAYDVIDGKLPSGNKKIKKPGS